MQEKIKPKNNSNWVFHHKFNFIVPTNYAILKLFPQLHIFSCTHSEKFKLRKKKKEEKIDNRE